jgi:putative transposase
MLIMAKASKLKQNVERKGYKFRLIVPNSDVERKLAGYVGCCRLVWNKALSLVKEDDALYRSLVRDCEEKGLATDNIVRTFRFNPYYQLSSMLKLWKEDTKTSFLVDCYSKSLQITLEELGQAITEAKSKTNPKCYPVFKKKGIKDSFSFNGSIKHDDENGRIFIPKIGYIRYRKSRDVLGVVKNVTISKQGKYWYVSLQSEKQLSYRQISGDFTNIIGIDVGITKAVSCSHEISFEYQNKRIATKQISSVNSLKQYQKKLAKLQRDLARKDKFSKNWVKQKSKINKLHTKIGNTRQDFLHKVTTAIVENNAYIAVERLKIKNMSKSAKGTIDNPGKNVKAKSGLNKSILDQGWGMFRQFLSYKLKYIYGTELIEVNPQYTSQQCSQCGYTDKENRKNQASFNCKQCGYKMNADINASLNIKAAGLAVLACGVGTKPMVKQEPSELYYNTCIA